MRRAVFIALIGLMAGCAALDDATPRTAGPLPYAGARPPAIEPRTYAGGAPRDLSRIVDRQLATNKVIGLFARYDPQVQDDLAEVMERAHRDGGPALIRTRVRDAALRIPRRMLRKHAARGSDEAVLDLAWASYALTGKLYELRGSCAYDVVVGTATDSEMREIRPLFDRYIAALENLVQSSMQEPRIAPDPSGEAGAITRASWTVEQREGVKAEVLALEDLSDPEVCRYLRGLLAEMLSYPPHRAAYMLRAYYFRLGTID
jgi:hypothetical protein